MRAGRSSRKGPAFDPADDEHVEHRRLGVWDLYLQRNPKLSRLPAWPKLEESAEMINDLPYVWRTLLDLRPICGHLLALYLVMMIGHSLLPALSLWYSGQLLKIVQIAVDERTVDRQFLFKIAGGRVACALARRCLSHFMSKLFAALNGRIRLHFSTHIFHIMARLDVPTFEDPVVSQQLSSSVSTSSRSNVAWEAISSLFNIGSAGLRLLAQSLVLVAVLREQRDGFFLAFICSANYVISQFNQDGELRMGGRAWAATTRNQDYLRIEGLKKLISSGQHRKELVAGGLVNFLEAEYRTLVDRLGNGARDFWDQYEDHMTKERISLLSLLELPLEELPQIAFALRAVQYPSSIPVSLASLHLLQQTTTSFTMRVSNLMRQAGSLSNRLSNLRKLYEAANIKNKVPDGTAPFPENAQTVQHGISLEFRNVSFRYPGSEEYALRDVSFKAESGQLCVIVGTNGSGKSTVLKLIARIYDTTSGTILIDGRDITTLKLDDLRRAMAILFQDYTLFPLSIYDNIALGDPAAATPEKVMEAARLGGAVEFVSRLPDGFDTYVERPVRDLYSGLPEDTKTLFGRSVNHSRLRGHMAGGREGSGDLGLSGGQLQRLAVARTFMRSSVSEPTVGLLLFDEPSASLDPKAEQDLFARLRELRGNKTMVFSTHRFGNLTRHADLIMYMNDALVLETGTHEELLKRDGDYARLWRMQAEAFL
ncbi:P-loop containing nucleoside triphosphate hydrolase protein [Auriscalpium vulgare]|uniref:P-loop containing nucleoside triphosphate hydrolase protein n=1 Tax=Auriscalpium vulgare TaxID=40419 RepID=A0ACB8RG55_9AGAM|nr:P-loop containing nucleoside triphosphate hydrolase protein [Auriscalpium vulgare]